MKDTGLIPDQVRRSEGRRTRRSRPQTTHRYYFPKGLNFLNASIASPSDSIAAV